jgi:hypothetical protein
VQINIPFKWIALVAALLLVAGAVAIILFRPEWIASLFVESTTTSAISDDPSAQAVIAGVQAFYTIDYTEPMEAWTKRVCMVTTPDGCEVIMALYAPIVYAAAQANKVQTGCAAIPVRMVEESADGNTRVWLLDVTLTQPWPGVQSPMQLYADAVLGEDGIWRMNHILLDQESERFATPAALGTVEAPTP